MKAGTAPPDVRVNGDETHTAAGLSEIRRDLS
jgi:hypothetical protein